jgi:two-component system, cell cycle sensor histidine kinase and response regulator CckA
MSMVKCHYAETCLAVTSGGGPAPGAACEALAESSGSFRALTARAPDAIVMMDDQGAISLWNEAAEVMFGYTTDEALGRNLHELTAPPGERASADEKVSLFAETGRGPVVDRITERIAIRKDGTQFPLALSVTGVRLHGRWMAVGIARDLTSESRIRSALLQTQKMEAVGRMAGGIAHDFNNLIQAIQGNAELLLLDEHGRDASAEELRQILRAADRCRELTRHLLTFCRGIPASPQVLDLNRHLAGVCRLVARTIPQTIRIELDLADDLARTSADATQIEQVILNLLLNAREAMPTGGTIRVQTLNVTIDDGRRERDNVPPGAYVRLQVADTGVGMAPETMQRVFEPFFTTKGIGKGNGLGLAIVYGIVSAHNGWVECASQRGVGTTFQVFLPACGSAARPAECDPPTARVAPRPATTILVVDDEPELLTFCEEALARFGFTVVTACDGETALRLYAEGRGRFAAVVLDLVMPGMGGFRCLQELHRIDPHVRAIIASGFVPDEATTGEISRMAREVLVKPYRIHELVDALHRALNGHGSSQRSAQV